MNSTGIGEWKNAPRTAASAAPAWALLGYDLNDGSVFNCIVFNYIMDTPSL